MWNIVDESRTWILKIAILTGWTFLLLTFGINWVENAGKADLHMYYGYIVIHALFIIPLCYFAIKNVSKKFKHKGRRIFMYICLGLMLLSPLMTFNSVKRTVYFHDLGEYYKNKSIESAAEIRATENYINEQNAKKGMAPPQ